MKHYFSLTLLATAVLAGCATTSITPTDVTNGYNSIQADELAKHVKVLASDEFGGRAPSSPGEKLTLDYLTAQFKALGLEPGNGDSYLQEVPLVSLRS